MKINADNKNISPTDKSIKREPEKAGKQKKENNEIKYKDRVELSGEPVKRINYQDKKSNPYSDPVNRNESGVTRNINHISRNEKISPEKLAEIKEKIAKGYYDTEEVIDSVSKIIFQDVKKIDKNI